MQTKCCRRRNEGDGLESKRLVNGPGKRNKCCFLQVFPKGLGWASRTRRPGTAYYTGRRAWGVLGRGECWAYHQKWKTGRKLVRSRKQAHGKYWRESGGPSQKANVVVQQPVIGAWPTETKVKEIIYRVLRPQTWNGKVGILSFPSNRTETSWGGEKRKWSCLKWEVISSCLE